MKLLEKAKDIQEVATKISVIPTTSKSAKEAVEPQLKSKLSKEEDNVDKPVTATSVATATTSNAPLASPVPSAVKDTSKRPSLKRHKDSIKECKPLNVLVYAETATARESAINILKEVLAENT